jgi:hypothetical protein
MRNENKVYDEAGGEVQFGIWHSIVYYGFMAIMLSPIIVILVMYVFGYLR